MFAYLCYDPPWWGAGGAEGDAREGDEEGGGEDLHDDDGWLAVDWFVCVCLL